MSFTYLYITNPTDEDKTNIKIDLRLDNVGEYSDSDYYSVFYNGECIPTYTIDYGISFNIDIPAHTTQKYIVLNSNSCFSSDENTNTNTDDDIFILVYDNFDLDYNIELNNYYWNNCRMYANVTISGNDATNAFLLYNDVVDFVGTNIIYLDNWDVLGGDVEVHVAKNVGGNIYYFNDVKKTFKLVGNGESIVPSMPINFNAIVYEDGIKLVWDDSYDIGGKPFCYNVYASKYSQSEVFVGRTKYNEFWYKPDEDGEYYFYIVGCNDAGLGDMTFEISVKYGNEIYAPLTPKNFMAGSYDGRLVMRWDRPADLGGSNIEYYEVYVNGLPVGNTKNLYYIYDDVSVGKVYSVKVRAKNGAGFSDFTQELDVEIVSDSIDVVDGFRVIKLDDGSVINGVSVQSVVWKLNEADIAKFYAKEKVEIGSEIQIEYYDSKVFIGNVVSVHEKGGVYEILAKSIEDIISSHIAFLKLSNVTISEIIYNIFESVSPNKFFVMTDNTDSFGLHDMNGFYNGLLFLKSLVDATGWQMWVGHGYDVNINGEKRIPVWFGYIGGDKDVLYSSSGYTDYNLIVRNVEESNSNIVNQLYISSSPKSLTDYVRDFPKYDKNNNVYYIELRYPAVDIMKVLYYNNSNSDWEEVTNYNLSSDKTKIFFVEQPNMGDVKVEYRYSFLNNVIISNEDSIKKYGKRILKVKYDWANNILYAKRFGEMNLRFLSIPTVKIVGKTDGSVFDVGYIFDVYHKNGFYRNLLLKSFTLPTFEVSLMTIDEKYRLWHVDVEKRIDELSKSNVSLEALGENIVNGGVVSINSILKLRRRVCFERLVKGSFGVDAVVDILPSFSAEFGDKFYFVSDDNYNDGYDSNHKYKGYFWVENENVDSLQIPFGNGVDDIFVYGYYTNDSNDKCYDSRVELNLEYDTNSIIHTFRITNNNGNHTIEYVDTGDTYNADGIDFEYIVDGDTHSIKVSIYKFNSSKYRTDGDAVATYTLNVDSSKTVYLNITSYLGRFYNPTMECVGAVSLNNKEEGDIYVCSLKRYYDKDNYNFLGTNTLYVFRLMGGDNYE